MPYDLFISYAHRDNARGQVRELCEAIAGDFSNFAGRNLQVFFDEQDIPSMVDWNKRISQGLRESRLFLAVLSPNYIASAYCRKEWDEYVRYEAMRQCLGEGMAPVYFIELPKMDGPGVEQGIARWVYEIRRRQRCDLASQHPVKIMPWHDAGKLALEDAEVARRLKVLKEQMAERLQRADRARQSPTNIYRHNPQFVGRVRELTILRETLSESGGIGVVGHDPRPAAAAAVHGVGGMGKTELALAYSHAFAWDYPGGRWLIRAENLDSLDLALRQLAGPLRVEFTDSEKKDLHLAGERILDELRRRDRSLLLLDNVTHASLLGPDATMRLPPQGQVHLIATSRLGPAQLAGSTHDHTFVAVDQLPTDDALALIQAHQPGARFTHADDEDAARELVEQLDGFTLAVETAAIYLGRRAGAGTIAAYAQSLRQDPLGISETFAADPMVAVRRKEKLLERILETTFQTLTEEQIQVLTFGALLPAEQVAVPWLRTLAGAKFPAFHLDAGSSAEPAWKQLTESLYSLRLLQPGDDVWVARMHRLTQAALQRRSGRGLEAMEHDLLTHVRSRAHFLADGWFLPDYQWEMRPLVACGWLWIERDNDAGPRFANEISGPLGNLAGYAEQELLLRRALEIVERRLGPDHADVGVVLGNLGTALLVSYRLAEAEPMLRRALAIAEKNFGLNHPKIAGCLDSLSTVLKKTDRQPEAEQLLRRAIGICERHDDPFLATCLADLGELLMEFNRLAEAEPMLRQALAREESKKGPNHPTVAAGLLSVARLCMKTNRLAEAEPLLRRSLAILERSQGPEHPNFAVGLGTLAELLSEMNRPAEAEALLRQSLAIEENIHGPNHPHIATTMHNLAMMIMRVNKLPEAEQLLRRSLAASEQNFGPRHTGVAGPLLTLGGLLRETNRTKEAEPLVRRALAIVEQAWGPEHIKVAQALNGLALLLLGQHRPAEAEPLLRRALAIEEKSLGQDHPEVAAILGNLAQLLQATDRLDEAEPMLRRALAIEEKSRGHVHPAVAIALNNLAQLLQAKGRLDEAEALLRRALAIDEKHLGPDHPNVAIRLNNLTQLLHNTQRFGEAEPMIRRALALAEQDPGKPHPLLATSLSNLAQLLASTGRLREAEPLFRRALEIDEKNLGPRHPDVASDLDGLSSLLTDLRRLEEAEPLLRRALEIEERSRGPNNPKIAGKLVSLVYLLLEDNRLAEAEPPLRRAIEITVTNDPAGFQTNPDVRGYIGAYLNLMDKMGLSRQQQQDRINEVIRPFSIKL